MKIKIDFITNSSSTNYTVYHVTIPKNFHIKDYISPSEMMKFFGDSLKNANPEIALTLFDSLIKENSLSYYKALAIDHSKYEEMRDTYFFIIKILRELKYISFIDDESDWEGIIISKG
jgi:hypothetical protein